MFSTRIADLRGCRMQSAHSELSILFNERNSARKPITRIETEKRDKRNGYFGWVRCRTRTYALLCMKSRNDGLCMQENIHPLDASVRAGEDSGSGGRTSVDECRCATADATAASRCFRGAFAYPLVYTFSISGRGSAPQRGRSVCARNCTTPVSPYRRYVVANLRALAI